MFPDFVNFSVSRLRVSKYAFASSQHLLTQSSNKNTRKRCEIYSNLTIKSPERRQWRRSGAFIVNLEHISYLF